MDLPGNIKGETANQGNSTLPQGQPVQQSPDKIYAEKLNMLARQERTFRQREAQFKDMEQKLAEYESKFNRVKESPLEGLEELGLKYDDLVIQGMNQDPTAKLEAKIAKLEKMLTDKQSKDSESAVENEKTSWIDFVRNEIKDKEDFELINTLNAHGDVYNYIEKHFNDTGEQMDVLEAAKLVEEDITAKLKVFQNSKKMKSLFEIQSDRAMENPADKVNTLSNSMSGVSVPSNQGLSENERLQAAIAALRAGKSR